MSEDRFAALMKELVDETAYVRSCAARSLGNLGDLRAVEPLISALSDRDFWVVGSAAEALGKLGDLRAVAPLTRTLKTFPKVNKPRLKIEIIFDALAPGRLFYHEARSRLLKKVIAALGTLGDKSCAPGLRLFLNYADKDVRRYCAIALAELKDEASYDPLIHFLTTDSSMSIADVAVALGKLGDARAVPVLIKALKVGWEQDRAGTVKGLSFFDDPWVFEAMVAMLQDRHYSVRRAAVIGLGNSTDVRTVIALTEALDDLDSWVRDAAWKSLVQLGAAAVAGLIAALKSKKYMVRKGSVQALSAIGDPRAFEPLIGALSDGTPWVRFLACKALSRMGDSRAIPALLTLENDPDFHVRRRATRAVNRLRFNTKN